jgi:hypothetical protein
VECIKQSRLTTQAGPGSSIQLDHICSQDASIGCEPAEPACRGIQERRLCCISTEPCSTALRIMHSQPVSTVQHKQCLWLCRSTCKCHAAHKGAEAAEWSSYLRRQGARRENGPHSAARAYSHLVNPRSTAHSILSAVTPPTHHPSTASADRNCILTCSSLPQRGTSPEDTLSCPPPLPSHLPQHTCTLQSCLAASNWDMSAAMEALRLKGLAAAVKKASRHASEGLVGIHQVGCEYCTTR